MFIICIIHNMKYTGDIDINQDNITPEVLNNPTLKIENVLIEAIFTDENGNKHSRFIKLDSNVSNITNIRLDDDIKKHSLLGQFK